MGRNILSKLSKAISMAIGIGNLGLYMKLAHIFIATPIYRPFMVTFKLGRVPSAMHIFLEQKRKKLAPGTALTTVWHFDS